jgi:hypothetical protein
VEYNYLACDGPNCEPKRDIRNDNSDASAAYDQVQGDNQGAEAATNEQSPAVDEPAWVTLDTGAEVFHFCTYDCLTAFVNDPAAPDNAISRFNTMFGYESNP